ncbi:hypothetical protein GH733_012626, partial [Mirounga leonina]
MCQNFLNHFGLYNLQEKTIVKFSGEYLTKYVLFNFPFCQGRCVREPRDLTIIISLGACCLPGGEKKDPSAVPPAGEWQLRVCIMSVMDSVGPFADTEPAVMLSLP